MERLYPAAQIQISVWEDSTEYLGVAKATLPDITYPVVTINAVGMMGSQEVPLYGMVDNMSMSIDFQTMTQAQVNLMTPVKHQLELRMTEEYWNNEESEVGIWADKFVVICRTKNSKIGGIAPLGDSDASGEYDVYYFAAYKDGEQLWEIDKRNMKCVINGVDYMTDVRAALGY